MILKVYIYFPAKIVLYVNSFIYTIFRWENKNAIYMTNKN